MQRLYYMRCTYAYVHHAKFSFASPVTLKNPVCCRELPRGIQMLAKI